MSTLKRATSTGRVGGVTKRTSVVGLVGGGGASVTGKIDFVIGRSAFSKNVVQPGGSKESVVVHD
jgi:hypothetical protein